MKYLKFLFSDPLVWSILLGLLIAIYLV